MPVTNFGGIQFSRAIYAQASAAPMAPQNVLIVRRPDGSLPPNRKPVVLGLPPAERAFRVRIGGGAALRKCLGLCLCVFLRGLAMMRSVSRGVVSARAPAAPPRRRARRPRVV